MHVNCFRSTIGVGVRNGAPCNIGGCTMQHWWVHHATLVGMPYCQIMLADGKGFSPDPTLFSRINWELLQGTGKQRKLLCYLAYRMMEISDRNIRECYMELCDSTQSGSLKKQEYRAKFESITNMLLGDDRYYYILEGIQFYVIAKIAPSVVMSCLHQTRPSRLSIVCTLSTSLVWVLG